MAHPRSVNDRAGSRPCKWNNPSDSGLEANLKGRISFRKSVSLSFAGA